MLLKQRHKIELEELTHTYRVDGIVKPALTRVLSPLNDFTGIPASVLEKAAKRGSDLHLMIHYAIKDTLDMASLDSNQKVLMGRFLDWLYELGFKIEDCHSEIRMYHDQLDLCCTADLLIGDSIYEMKFGQIKDVYVGAQTAAQADMVENNFGIKIKNRYALFPDPKGKFKTKPYKSKEDYRIFRRLHQYHRNIENYIFLSQCEKSSQQDFVNKLMER